MYHVVVIPVHGRNECKRRRQADQARGYDRISGGNRERREIFVQADGGQPSYRNGRKKPSDSL